MTGNPGESSGTKGRSHMQRKTTVHTETHNVFVVSLYTDVDNYTDYIE